MLCRASSGGQHASEVSQEVYKIVSQIGLRGQKPEGQTAWFLDLPIYPAAHEGKRRSVHCSKVYGVIVKKDGVLRCSKASYIGCIFCGFGTQSDKNDRFEQLRLQHLKLYDYEMNKLCMREVIDYINYYVPRPEGQV